MRRIAAAGVAVVRPAFADAVSATTRARLEGFAGRGAVCCLWSGCSAADTFTAMVKLVFSASWWVAWVPCLGPGRLCVFGDVIALLLVIGVLF